MRQRTIQHHIDGLASLLLFGVFAACVLMVLLTGADYATWLYCRDGWLMELYCYADEPLGPEDGERLLEAERMELSLEEGLLTVTIVTPGGEEDTLRLSLRGGEGVEA